MRGSAAIKMHLTAARIRCLSRAVVVSMQIRTKFSCTISWLLCLILSVRLINVYQFVDTVIDRDLLVRFRNSQSSSSMILSVQMSGKLRRTAHILRRTISTDDITETRITRMTILPWLKHKVPTSSSFYQCFVFRVSILIYDCTDFRLVILCEQTRPKALLPTVLWVLK